MRRWWRVWAAAGLAKARLAKARPEKARLEKARLVKARLVDIAATASTVRRRGRGFRPESFDMLEPLWSDVLM
jgi:hypothetical protein